MTASVRGQLGIAALMVAGAASAADNLPPLRVDPVLLGLPAPAVKPAPAPAAVTPAKSDADTTAKPAATATTTTVSDTPVAPVVAASPPLEAAQKTSKTSKPAKVAPMVPAAAATPPAPVVAPIVSPSPAAAVLKERPVSPPPAPVKTQAMVAAAPPADKTATAGGAQGLPAFRVDPALLGGAMVASRARGDGAESASAATVAGGTAVAGGHTPPFVAAQPKVPPLYSEHVKAGMLPGPDGKKTKDNAIYLAADKMTGLTDQEVVAEGNVELQKQDATLTTDKLTYWPVEDEVEAEGNVKLRRATDKIDGPKMRLNLTESTGYFDKPEYSISRQIVLKKTPMVGSQVSDANAPPATRQSTGVGRADRIDFEGDGQYKLNGATYSTCTGDTQDWYAQFNDLKLDYNTETGTGHGAKLYFKDVPVLWSPWLDFSLNNKRKTGLLAPTLVSNTSTGLQYVQPFYWNIAPNMDSTITSRAMARRGVQVNADLRYIDYNYSGQSRFEYLPDDKVAQRTRSAYSIVHNQNFGAGFTGGINLNRVSDDAYFTDLTTKVSLISQGNLVNQGNLAYSGGWWNANVLAQKYQTLQDPLAPIVPPYERLPQATVNATRPDLPMGTTLGVLGEYSNFSHPTLVNGQRMVFYPQLSLPLQSAAFYVTPKVGVHSTSYTLQNQGAGVASKMSRQVPISSLDAGATLDRTTDWFGRSLNQTLEPRLYYVYIPKVEQGNIPVFDSALADFNFAQIFSENRYVGGDRIGDANQMTAAVTSRLIDPNTGAELIRGMVGQRYYFADQYVTLPGETKRTSRQADWLASLSGLVAPRTYVDSGIQYNADKGRTERYNIAGRYQPEIGKVLNAGYRYTRDSIGQIDVSAQWPISGGWSGVGRVNYSTKDQRMIEGVAGFEYSAGCWAVRGVLQQLSTTAQSQITSFFIQLELSDFSNIGSNPNEILRRNVPGYARGGQFATDTLIKTE